jgi:3-oxoacyl-[acyl-carrier protein] reductase
MKMQGKVALITGAGRGIGRSTALLFAREGADIALNAEIPDEIEQVAQEVRALGRRAYPIVADMLHEEQIGSMVRSVIAEMGPIDAMVYSAGVAIHNPVDKLATRDWDLNFGVNVRGLFLLSRELVPHMVARRSGTMVNISSKLGKEGSALRSAYSSSKHAVVGFTSSLAQEVKAYGVRVNAVCPGPVATPLRARNYPDEDPSTITQPEEVAQVILFLSCEDSVAINGAALDVAWKGEHILPTVKKA